ncbi:hypothetical protein GCM10011390_38280 [Aureimonas endophytica]|uniref:Uncharacterized protein n=1 Tax=Aureimonas endophytica TaxID=2027858 RepID=A0A917E957_9HYPH|nr:hypothetical protein GCM10011390_38280 [Aureimonas endophytica]
MAEAGATAAKPTRTANAALAKLMRVMDVSGRDWPQPGKKDAPVLRLSAGTLPEGLVHLGFTELVAARTETT